MAVKYLVLANSRLSTQLSDREVKCVEEVTACSNSHASTIPVTCIGTLQDTWMVLMQF